MGFGGARVQNDAADRAVQTVHRPDVSLAWLVVLLCDILRHDFAQARFASAASLYDIAARLLTATMWLSSYNT